MSDNSIKSLEIKMKEINWRKILFYSIIIISFFIVFIWCTLTPLLADDYNHSVNSLYKAFMDTYKQYFNYGGRSIAHFLCRTVLLFPKWVYNIINSAFYIGLTLLMYKLSNPKEKYDFKLILFINTVLFVHLNLWGQTIIWVSGAANYMWTSIFMLLFILQYNDYIINDKNKTNSIIPIVSMFILGVLAGWGNENTSGGTILIVLFYFIIGWLYKKKITPWMISGLIGSIIGFLLLALAPGNSGRQDNPAFNWFYGQSFLKRSFKNFYHINSNINVFLSTLIIIFFILYFYYLYTNKSKDKKNTIILAPLWFLTSMAIAYALILSPTTGGRAFFGVFIFFIIGLANIYSKLKDTNIDKIIANILISILCVQFVFSFTNGFYDLTNSYILHKEREEYINEQISLGNKNLVVYPVVVIDRHSALYGISDIFPDRNMYPNTAISNYYNIDTINSVDKEIWDKTYLNGDIDLMKTTDIYTYLKLLKNDDYIIFFSANDDTSQGINDEIIGLMGELGLKSDLRDKFRWSYLAIIDQGEVVFEEHKEGPIINYGSDYGFNYHIESSGKFNNKDNISIIKIEDTDYSKNLIGLNIVVYDINKRHVVDSVNFNTNEGLSWHR